MPTYATFIRYEQQQVVTRLPEGNEVIFTRLYQAACRMVYFHAFKILGQSEQMTQDVFITVFRTIGSLKAPEALRS